jgi:site-specific recombinase XerC
VSDLLEPDFVSSLLRHWSRSLRARGRSPRTIQGYTDSAERLAAYTREHGRSVLDRALVEDYLADLADQWKPTTVAFRYRSLQQWTKWLLAEGEIDEAPIAGMHAPAVPEQLLPVLSTDELRSLLKACEGRGFAERRDAAIIRLFLDTGMRLGEMAGGCAPAPSARRPARHSTGTCESVRGTHRRVRRLSGSPSALP